MTLPNFLVIGAAKSGTTALHKYLSQHPQIFMSTPKELRFFPFENQPPDFRGPGDKEDMKTIVKRIEDYRAVFAEGNHLPARGETSPIYLYYERSAARIRQHIPDVKLIAILRHPADRAYSHYLSKIRDGLERLSFRDALAAEQKRIGEGYGHGWHYRRRGFYAAQLRRYFDLFKREQFRIYLYEDYVSDPLGMMRDIFRFLNVDETLVPDMSMRHNESNVPRNRALQVFLTEPRAAKNLVKTFVPARWSRRVGDHLRRRNLTKPTFPTEVRQQLIDVYREDIQELQDLIGRDLAHWLV